MLVNSVRLTDTYNDQPMTRVGKQYKLYAKFTEILNGIG